MWPILNWTMMMIHSLSLFFSWALIFFSNCFYVLIITCFYSLWILQMHNVQWQLDCLWLHVMVSKEYLDCAGWWWEQIGISAPQGCGKTTIVDSLEYLFNSLGRLVQNHFSHLQISCHFSNAFSKKAAQLMCWKLQSSSCHILLAVSCPHTI